MIVSRVQEASQCMNQSHAGMHFLREVLPAVVREVGCAAKRVSEEKDEECHCPLCQVMGTFDGLNALTMADLLFAGQSFFGTRPVAQNTRDLRDTWGVSNFLSFFVLYSLKPGVSPIWDDFVSRAPSDTTLSILEALKDFSRKLSPPSLEECERHLQFVSVLPRFKYGSTFDNLSHEVEYSCWQTCRTNLHCFLVILFMSDSNEQWSRKHLFRGSLVISCFLELSSYARLIPELFTRPNILRIFLDFVPQMLSQGFCASDADGVTLIEACIGVLDVFATILGKWPCKMNSKGPLFVAESPVCRGVDSEDWPLNTEEQKARILLEVSKSGIVSCCESVTRIPKFQKSSRSKLLKEHILKFQILLQLVADGFDCVPWYTHLDLDREDRNMLRGLPIFMISQMVQTNRNRCHVCNSEVNVSRCRGCKMIAYCSEECQLKHWSVHKQVCRLVQQKV